MNGKAKLLILTAIIILALALMACTIGSACYSQFPGCEATAAAIATAAAH